MVCLKCVYSSPYYMNASSALLNAVLTAWTSLGCNGTVRFTSSGATLQLDSEYSVNGASLVLDASGLASPVTLLPASQSRHFSVRA